MLRAIFWDNDGVLVDTERLYWLATQQVLGTVGISLTAEQYCELFLVQAKGAWHLAAEKGITPDVIDAMRKERGVRYASLLSTGNLVIEGVREVLQFLHGRYRMGIVTSSERDHFDSIHRSTDLLRYFDFVLTAGDYPRSKPHPDPYLVALERTGFAAADCLAIEDSERGLASARAAGLRCVVIPTDLTRAAALSGAHRVLASISELLACLED